MDEQRPSSARGPLYDPIVFVYTQTIGQKRQTKDSGQVPTYIQKYQDILIPHSQHNRVLYYLFHIAPIYNWLRSLQPFACNEREELAKYISKQSPSIKNTSQSSETKMIKQTLLSHYAQKWEVVKLCIKNKLFVKSVGDVQGSHLVCRHYIKAQVWSQFYSYDFKKKQIMAEKFYCKECDGIVRAQVQVQQICWAPMFDGFYGENITIKGEKFILAQYFTDKMTCIRASNRVWYQMESPTYVMKLHNGALQLTKNQKGIFVYCREKMFSQCGVLKIAKDLPLGKIKVQEINQASGNIKKIQSNKFKREQKEKKLEDSQKIVEELDVIDKKRIEVVGDVSQQYQQAISKLYEQQKEKDQYEKDYDKGKTKKIKKKHQYPRPDFNEIFKQVKAMKPQDEEQEQRPRSRFANKNFGNRGRPHDGNNRGKRPFRGRHEGFSNPEYRKGHERRRHDEANFKKKWEQS